MDNNEDENYIKDLMDDHRIGDVFLCCYTAESSKSVFFTVVNHSKGKYLSPLFKNRAAYVLDGALYEEKQHGTYEVFLGEDSTKTGIFRLIAKCTAGTPPRMASSISAFLEYVNPVYFARGDVQLGLFAKKAIKFGRVPLSTARANSDSDAVFDFSYVEGEINEAAKWDKSTFKIITESEVAIYTLAGGTQVIKLKRGQTPLTGYKKSYSVDEIIDLVKNFQIIVIPGSKKPSSLLDGYCQRSLKKFRKLQKPVSYYERLATLSKWHPDVQNLYNAAATAKILAEKMAIRYEHARLAVHLYIFTTLSKYVDVGFKVVSLYELIAGKSQVFSHRSLFTGDWYNENNRERESNPNTLLRYINSTGKEIESITGVSLKNMIGQYKTGGLPQEYAYFMELYRMILGHELTWDFEESMFFIEKAVEFPENESLFSMFVTKPYVKMTSSDFLENPLFKAAN